jgi:hypothetical protein
MMLSNQAAQGDPLDNVSLMGFDSYDDALTFVEQGFQIKGLKPAVKGTLVRGGPAMEIPGYPYVVFYRFTDGQIQLMSITQLYGDLPALALHSWGAQLLIST